MTSKTQRLTIADWDAMPVEDGYRYEIIEGELFVSEWPGLTHQVILTDLVAPLGNFLRTNLTNRAIERYVNQGSTLTLQETLGENATLTTPALPGFSCHISEIFSQF
jgi:hypothetical protein